MSGDPWLDRAPEAQALRVAAIANPTQANVLAYEEVRAWAKRHWECRAKCGMMLPIIGCLCLAIGYNGPDTLYPPLPAALYRQANVEPIEPIKHYGFW